MRTEDYLFDFCIIGSGIIGMAIARDLINRDQSYKICIIEKEKDVAYHSSGRNSGVLHAGFYYTADSLKAKFTKDGNSEMTKFCEDNGLKINKCAKVVVAKDSSELTGLYELEKRGKTNGVNVSLIDEDELQNIEPNAKTFKKALFSPNTSTVDPKEVCLCLKNELLNKGVQFFFNEEFKKIKRDYINIVYTSTAKKIKASKVINCAGLYADIVAKEFGFSEKYTIIPFKGLYVKYCGDSNPVNMNIYPVPNLKNPFLGVHYTVTVNENVKIGPTAIPAFWRENYCGFKNFKLSEFFSILSWEAYLFVLNKFNFRSLAFEEIKKYSKKYFTSLGKILVKDINVKYFKEKTPPGIRAQLLNKETKELVQDFVVEGDSYSVHILNAVSPAFTCSFPFAKWVVDNHVFKN